LSPEVSVPIPKIGEAARPLRLPSAQGGDVRLEEFEGRKAVVVWFSKGMACPFCRQKLSQIARAADRIHGLDAEVLYVTTTPVDRARLYARQFRLPFPYLCDAEGAARAAWGLEVRAHSLPWYAGQLVKGLTGTKLASDYGDVKPSFAEMPKLLADDDMGFFIVDRGGVVRYALAGSYFEPGGAARGIPGNDEIVRELQRCAAVA
jgi:peroxiredoxin